MAQYHYFAGYSLHPSPMGWSHDWVFLLFLVQQKMADSAQKFIDTEAFSCLRQAFVCFLIHFSRNSGLPATHSAAIDACEAHFNFWEPTPIECPWMVSQQ